MPMRYIGYACINMSLAHNHVDSNGQLVKVSQNNKVFTNRQCRQSSFNLDFISPLILKNVNDLLTIIKWNAQHNIYLFRISSDIFPFIDHPELTYNIDDLKDGDKIKSVLEECGRIGKEHNMRFSMHPGPYTCIASPSPQIANKSLLSIEKHTLMADLMHLDDFVINIHVGGMYDNIHETASRFISSFNRLSDKSKRYLTIENDDKQSLWSIEKLYDFIYKYTKIPIVLDVHHWKFNNNSDLNSSCDIAFSTWGNKIPKIHYSESRDDITPTAHSDYIVNDIPEFSGEYDVMVEAKSKELAVLKYLSSRGQ